MPTLLRIDVSPRGDYSVSKKLADAATAAWLAKNPTGTVTTRDLSKGGPLPFVDLPWITAAYSAPDSHSQEQKAAIAVSNELIAELKSADTILISSPLYNFTLPAALKAWVDHIVRFNVTFGPNYVGLVTGKKAFVIVAGGADYSPGSPASGMDFFSPYIKALFGFIGITDTSVYLAGNSSAVMQGKTTLEAHLAQQTPLVLEAFLK